MKEIQVIPSFIGEQGFNPEEFCPDVALILADIDYTFIDADIYHQEGISAIKKTFGEKFAKEVDDLFNLMIEGHRKSSDEVWDKRDEFNNAIEGIKKLQSSFVDQYGHKVWSRGTWIILTAEKLGKTLTKEEVEKSRDAYWEAVSNSSSLYTDVDAFIKGIEEKNIPLVLMTSSDSVLIVNDDLTIDYDPEFSEKRKRERLKQLSFKYDGLIIGDPYDKPDERFFDKVFKEIQGLGEYPIARILVIGDSKRNDLEVPQSRGCATLLIKRE
jgi:FMN phosphatase YigB (HAD superfamily)